MIDITIIGGGVIGCLIGRELSRYRVKALLVEKDSDIANGTTKANSAIVHAGFDAKPGTLKAKFNIEGNAMYDRVCEDLGVPLIRNGSLVLAFSGDELPELYALRGAGEKEQRARSRTPQRRRGAPPRTPRLGGGRGGPLRPDRRHRGALGTGHRRRRERRRQRPGTPAGQRGHGHRQDRRRLPRDGGRAGPSRPGWSSTARDSIPTGSHNLVSEPCFKIIPRRGEYFVLDRSEGDFVSHTIFQCPTPNGKGVLISPTVHGNLIIGPNAEQVKDPEHVETTAAGLKSVREAASRSCDGVAYNTVITSFAGVRSTPDTNDFIIGEVKGAPGFFDAAGIESPGLTSAPAIAVHVSALVRSYLGNPPANPDFNPVRRPMVHFARLDGEEKAAWIKKDPRFGRIVCRCESVTEGEIVDAIHRNAGATTVDGVKRRLRPGTGRCQGGFCGPRVLEILSRELHIPMNEVRKDRPASVLLTGLTKTATGE